MSETFMDAALSGRTASPDIDDWVDRWHEGDGGGGLADYLGMTADEYSLWVERPSVLPWILAARQQGKPLADFFSDGSHHFPMADEEGVREWLQETGRLP